MQLNLNDKHVLITGGSKGIGLACAIAFLQEGSKVTLVSRRLDNLKQAKENLLQQLPQCQGKIAIASADLRDAQSARQAFETAVSQSGPIDILVNSAGAAKRTPAPELTPAHWQDA